MVFLWFSLKYIYPGCQISIESLAADHSDAAISQESGNQMGRSVFFGEGGHLENMRYSWL